jgi:Tol biopolymer transport system component
MSGLMDEWIGGLVDWWIGTFSADSTARSLARSWTHPLIHSPKDPFIQQSIHPTAVALAAFALCVSTAIAGDAATLARELHGAGWLVFSAPNERADWDLFAIRPDGVERARLTDTPDTHEMGPRFSPDGKRLLYYRAPRSSVVGNNTYGTFELVIAAANGSAQRSLGDGHGWASWSPDGTRLACLAPDGIHFLDAATGRDLGAKIPRHGLVQQLVWSPDGRAFAGTANGLGPFWNIGVLSVDGGTPIAVSETERYNCTPDWTPDSAWVLYARGIIGGRTGYAQLWRARRDGSERQVLYAEEGAHIYGGCASPDGKFLVFTRSASDLGDKENKKITMSIVRLADAPLNLKAGATNVPRLDLGPGWEPHWTRHELSPPNKR